MSAQNSRPKFGKYDKVFPVETTPSRVVPESIERPEYVIGNESINNVTEPEKIEIKNTEQIAGMRRSCELAATILSRLDRFIDAGITTDEIDEFVHNLTINSGAYPSPLHYKGFPKSVCTSVNNVCVHGIPDLRPLKDGDIVNVDITVFYKGYHGDCSKTFAVGNVDDMGLELINITEECLDLAIRCCGPNVPFKEIGLEIYKHARKYGLTVMPNFCGHGIGSYFHGPPSIIHVPNRYPGVMHPGMTFTIEPAVSHGSRQAIMLDDGWTIVTCDNARCTQAEHTVLITEDGAEILTVAKQSSD